jgi:hypothetical protein
MKRLMLLCILLVCTQAGLCPPYPVIPCAYYEPINPYLSLWYAVCQVESKGDTLAFNPREMATGIVQLRPIMVRDYNQRAGKSYKLSDCYNKNISKEIFMWYASRYKPNEYRKIARFWNRSKTERYWNLVKKQLEMK